MEIFNLSRKAILANGQLQTHIRSLIAPPSVHKALPLLETNAVILSKQIFLSHSPTDGKDKVINGELED